MKRREFIGALSMAGLSANGLIQRALSASSLSANRSVKRVAVIGAGIVGACIAYYLSKRGCEVIVLEKRKPAAQASGNSFAWINAAYVKLPFHYHLLSTYGVSEYRRLANEVELPIYWGGSLEWYESKIHEADLIEGVCKIQEFGSPTSMIDRHRLEEIEPNLKIPGGWQVAYGRQDGTIDSAVATRTLLDRAKEHGAIVIYPADTNELRFLPSGTRVVTDVESFDVDRTVIAAGVGATKVAAMARLSLEQRPTPGIIVTTKPMDRILNTVVYGPGVHMHQRNDGRIVLGEKGGAPRTALHSEALSNRPNAYPSEDLAHQHANRIMNLARDKLPAIADAEVEHVGIGWRPMPPDGLPVVGRVKDQPGIYLAMMHSGVTLAPIVGRLAATEMLDDVDVELLSSFRFERLKQD